MKYKNFLLISFVFILIISACGTKSTVVLIPDPDGHVGKLEVSNQSGTQILDQANQSVAIKDKTTAPATPTKLSQSDIQADFSDVLDARPLPPERFILYFLPDSNQLTKESEALLPQIIHTIQKRPLDDIVISGHTDTVGSKEYNYRLSLERARTMFGILIANGAAPDRIKVTSHGEGNLLVKTTDNVAEPRNRRVEVVIR